MKRTFFILLSLLWLLSGCQHNDICTDKKPTTPRMVIKFYNIDRPDRTKAVTDFNFRAVGMENWYFSNNRNDTLVRIPLDAGTDLSKFEFTIHKGNPEKENSDQIQFTYSANEIYVSRACGFRNEYVDLDYGLADEGEANWIKAVEIPHNNEITDEETTHLYIYH